MQRRIRDVSLLDRVHEHVQLPPIVVRAIDTPAVQRLRGLKQLGASSFLYPGAVHTRFEHSIGVAHMARNFLTIIRSKQPELMLSTENIENVMLAGLCHDLGHGPFSHLFEDVITKRSSNPTSFCHEEMSTRLTGKLLAPFLDPERITEVLELMSGTATKRHPHSQLISNKRNGVDVDRLDYFLRDSVCCFGKPTVDVRAHRLFHTARVIKIGEDWEIAFEEKMAIAMRELFSLRAKLHKQVYQHQVTRAVGHMIGDAFHLAEPFFRVRGLSLNECCQDPDAFLALGDWILDAIEFDSDVRLRPAQSIIQRLRSRDLYKLIECRTLRPGVKLTFEEVTRGVMENRGSGSGIDTNDFIADVVTINHGRGDSDPLSYVTFFNPKREVPDPIRVPPCSSPLFSPQCFEERTVMIFQRRPSPQLSHAVQRWASWGHDAGLFAPHVPFFNPS